MSEPEKINKVLEPVLNEMKEKNALKNLEIQNHRLCKKCKKIEVDYSAIISHGYCEECLKEITLINKKIVIKERIQSSIPKKYQDIESDHPEYLNWTRAESLFIYGSPGSGKTVLATSIGKKIINEGNNINFISYPAFIMELQSAFKKDNENPFDISQNIARSSSILIIDDLGAEKLTEYVRQITYFILNEREQRCELTIITSNYSLDQLDEQFDARISSRIAGMCRVIKMSSRDRRLD